MPHPRTILVLLAASPLFTSCSDNETKTPPTPQPGQRPERVSIESPPIRETAAEDMRNSRASVMRVLADERDAITAPFPGEITLDLPPAPSTTFPSALTLTGWPADHEPPRATLLFEFDFVGPERTEKSSFAPSFKQAIAGWSPLLQPRGTDEAVKLIVRGKWVGGDVPPNLPPLRMALAMPDTNLLARQDPGINVLVISIDTLRADHLSCYGYARPTSPHIDALAARGALFENAYSPAPWTLPAYGSLFTGLLPADHRAGIVREREAAWGTDVTPQGRTTELLRPDVPTLAELLSQHGYQTAAFVCNPFLGAKAGLARGFHHYTSYQYNAHNGVQLAEEWIGMRKGSRWFAFLHVIDPHMPYAPPAPYDTQFAERGIDDLENWPPDLAALRAQAPADDVQKLLIDHYDGEIAFADAQIGFLLGGLEQAGMLDDTLIVLHSDHGEEFWEHGSCDHGHSQHDELLRVPLVLVLPGQIRPGTRVATRVRALDILPTIAHYAGFAPPAGIAGESLVPLLDAAGGADRDSISEGILHGTREIKAVVRGHDKLIAAGADANQLYDLSADPHERRDKSASSPELVTTLRAILRAHHEKAKASAAKAAPLELDEGSLQRMRNTGYGGAEIPAPKPPKKP